MVSHSNKYVPVLSVGPLGLPVVIGMYFNLQFPHQCCYCPRQVTASLKYSVLFKEFFNPFFVIERLARFSASLLLLKYLRIFDFPLIVITAHPINS